MKIALLGSAASVHKAPFRDSRYEAFVQGRLPDAHRAHGQVPGDWDIWGCSPGCWAVIPRASRWFEVHRWEPEQPWFSLEYRTFLQRFKGMVYTGAPVADIPSHVVYPIERMELKFSSYFMTSSLALMLALAIDTIEEVRAARRKMKESKEVMLDAGVPNCTSLNGFNPLPYGVDPAELEKDDSDDTIGMWGVDMAAHEEYAYQRPGCQFFILEALRRGINVYLPPESDLMRPMPVYGISEWDHNYIKLTQRAKEVNARAEAYQRQAAEAQQNIAGLQGEMHALNAFVNTWTSPYGLPHGITLECTDGNLGGGITHLDARPLETRDALAAMSAPPEVMLARELYQVLKPHVEANGEHVLETVQRIIRQRDEAMARLSEIAEHMLQTDIARGANVTGTVAEMATAKRKAAPMKRTAGKMKRRR